jgi:hypothetical protein
MMNAADEAAIRAQQSDHLRSELDRMVGEYNFALERKYTTPGVAQVLNELSGLLPDDTWLTQFEVKSTIRGKVTQREVYMRGESANAGKLISLLENATLVGHATPRSPTTKLNPGPGESFDIGAQLKPTPMPTRIALTETMNAPRRAAVAPAPPPAPTPAPVAPPAVAKAPPAQAETPLAADAAKAGGDAAATAGEAATPAKGARGARGEGRRARARNVRAGPQPPGEAPPQVAAPAAHGAGDANTNTGSMGAADADTGEAPEDAEPEDAQ